MAIVAFVLACLMEILCLIGAILEEGLVEESGSTYNELELALPSKGTTKTTSKKDARII